MGLADSLSPVLCNLIVDKIMKNIWSLLEYRLSDKNVNFICYTEEEVERLLHYNMTVLTPNRQSLTISKDPLGGILEVEGKMIEQVMQSVQLPRW